MNISGTYNLSFMATNKTRGGNNKDKKNPGSAEEYPMFKVRGEQERAECNRIDAHKK